MRLTCLGGAGEIGANSYLLEAAGQALLLDCGLHPKKEGLASLPLLSALPAEPDHILVTHAHLDHVGSLPYISKRFPRARIHMTEVARRFALRMLRNTVNVMRRRSEEAPPGADAGAVMLYNFDAVERLDDLIEGHALLEPIPLGRGVEAMFGSAGHIPGAAGLMVRDGAKSFYYTGDTCGHSQLLIPAAEYPPQADVVLCESTYGGNPHADAVRLEDQIARLGQLVARVTTEGGIVLIPCFALGRAQEILVAITRLIRKGRIPAGVPVYLTGLARAFSQLYDQTRWKTPRRDPELLLSGLGALPLEMDTVVSGGPPAPAIVIASSGMVLPHTLSNLLSRRVLPDEKCAIAVVGYNDPDTPGAKIMHSQVGAEIDLQDGKPKVERRCQVERFYFSAHSTRKELLGLLSRTQPKKTVLVHGDPTSSLALSDLYHNDSAGGETIRPHPGTPYDL